jgi:hypothetical protein
LYLGQLPEMITSGIFSVPEFDPSREISTCQRKSADRNWNPITPTNRAGKKINRFGGE